MEVSIISIGNSKGIRLSKAILDKYNFKKTIELILEKERIILKPKSATRKGWEKSFKKMHENQDDKSFMADVYKEENFEEWN
ncbi:MAG: AbrB/MazE/SpoVT family DNA-binding domain-containing protein [Bacteroidetes bacterium]|nr:AbrB/MazE/SpoVT family DNA-binding domain-containing protein [Bacteroidota bacterium]